MNELWEVIMINGKYYWCEYVTQQCILGRQDLREQLFYEQYVSELINH